MRRVALVSIFAFVCVLTRPALGEAPSFQRDVRPILSDHCFACHGPDAATRAADLRLDVAESAYESGAVSPNELAESELWNRINTEDDELRMPPAEHHDELSADEKEVLRRWIEAGAAYEQHWSFVAAERPEVPTVAGTAHPIDAFIRDRLNLEGIKPADAADKRTLIRRVTFDLTGLPPTTEEVESFIKDDSGDAYERLVDRLLSRVAYGEHMARYWLDLARYADTHGMHLDNERSMWPYRDWVVRAFHQNLPFDDFTRWQLAGDLLNEPTQDQLIASGFNRCNVTTGEGGSIAEEWVYRYAVDRTSTTAEVWMGLTAGCAVCHDHKFDPLSTKEYYSLYAFFHSAADPAMDGNKIDTPPILKLYSDADKKTIAALDRRLQSLEDETKAALASFEYTDPSTLDPPPMPEESESIWFEDAFPVGAKVEVSGEPVDLVNTEQGDVFSGEWSLERTADGLSQAFYNSGAKPLTVHKTSKITVRCLLDPENPPKTIMLQFHTNAWSHRAVWGEEALIPFGKAGTSQKVLMGDLPATGEWIELAVDAKKMGLAPGAKVTGYAFTQFAGTVTWDRLAERSTVDKVNDGDWSWLAWRKAKSGKRNNELPEGLRQLVREKQYDKWSEEENRRIFDHWLEKIHVGAQPLLADVNARRQKVLSQKGKIDASAPITFVMADLPKPRDSFVMIRGAYDKPGERVSRDVPSFLPPLPDRTDGQLYNRLDLANWLVDRSHPLTARVAVNRFWQQFFGTGLVRTSGDFGSQGEPPSHPELLDWLAVEFMENDWNVKRLVKQIVTSETYRQSSAVTAAKLEHDPANRLLSHAPRLRLDAEVLRDQALFVSGLLVTKVGGKAVKPYQPPDIWEPVGFGNSNTRYYKQDSGESLYRRSLYTFLKRTAPPPFMASFDAPNREQSCSVRGRTNTPMQALQLMNDVQHVEAARHLAVRMIREGGDSVDSRIEWIWRCVTCRPPTDAERTIAGDALRRLMERYAGDAAAAKELVSYGASAPDDSLDVSQWAAYTMLANLVLNLDETVTKN
ncbi:MAG: PSD1 and planctomycete cytochrome C domain-containing protein [Planctomycetota bacterium]